MAGRPVATMYQTIVPSWPPLPPAEWRPTRDTLHMWTQIVGKTRLALCPAVNHWWHAALYVTPRGLTTSAIYDGERTFSVDFDFIDDKSRLDRQRSTHESRSTTIGNNRHAFFVG